MSPEVSIILPVYNDETWIERALRSCTSQSLENIEIIVVDDASTDGTVRLVEKLVSRDERIRLVRQPSNRSALQGRRVGIEAARAPLILFLDGDDELMPEAAETARAALSASGADVLGFGCVVVTPDGRTGSRYEREMQPKFDRLEGATIVESIFPAGAIAQGQLWRYMFRREVLVAAYDLLEKDLVLPRVNDLPVVFLALAIARTYSSIPAVLYRYHFGLGASGHALQTLDDYFFTASAIESIEAIRGPVQTLADGSGDATGLLGAFRTVELSVIGRVVHYVHGAVDDELRVQCLDRLGTRVGWAELVTASVDYCPDACEMLSHAGSFAAAPVQGVHRVLLRTGNLRTGGVQGVLVAQAKYLVDAGYEVTIALDAGTSTSFSIPRGVDIIQIQGKSKSRKLDHFRDILRERAIDAIIDHHVFYNDDWPSFAMLAASLRVPMLAWIHNFALRPVLDGSNRLELMDRYLKTLSVVVVLSESDVTYWNARGAEHVVYIPNPPSPMLLEGGVSSAPKKHPRKRIEIAWWGRLQQSTKQVRELIKIGQELDSMGVPFRLTIIGPDSPDLSAEQLRKMARERGIESSVRLPGSLHGADLVAAIRRADVFVTASVIEGYPLVLVEAQAHGLPIVMYDLPWLAYLKDNAGVVTVAQKDSHGAARAIAALFADEAQFANRSAGGLAAAREVLNLDLTEQYRRLLDGDLTTEITAEDRATHFSILLDQSLQFTRLHAEREDRALKRARRELKDQRRSPKHLAKKSAGSSARRADSSGASGRTRDMESGARRGGTDRKRMPPAVRAVGIKAWLQSFLPATMRQTSYFARHHHSTSWAQHDEVMAELDYVSDRLELLDESVAALRRAAKNESPDAGMLSLDRGGEHLADGAPDEEALTPGADRAGREIATRPAMGAPRLRGKARMLLSDAARRGAREDPPREELLGTISTMQQSLLENVDLSTQSLRLQEREGRQVNRLRRSVSEIIWSQVYHDTIRDSEWNTDAAVSPGRWAVGYAFLYVLYRTLDEFHPSSILELGLGQSTKLIGQYANHHEGVSHVVIEHDTSWIDAFSKNSPLSPDTRIQRLDIIEPAPDSPSAPHRYADFANAVQGAKYDLILIDGPFGFGKDVARVDILEVLPESLADSFVLLLDDAERAGELATSKLIETRLTDSGVAFEAGFYHGEKDVWMAVSPDLKFLLSL